jgi:hypothetical protein
MQVYAVVEGSKDGFITPLETVSDARSALLRASPPPLSPLPPHVGRNTVNDIRKKAKYLN